MKKEVSRLRHYISVLWKWCHKQELKIGELVEREGEVGKEEVAVEEVAKEVEAGVPDPIIVSHIVAVGDEDVVVSGVAGGVVALLVEEAELGMEPSVALVRLPEGVKKRRLEGSSGLEVVEDLAVVKALLGLWGLGEGMGKGVVRVPTVPSRQFGRGFGIGGGRGRGVNPGSYLR